MSSGSPSNALRATGRNRYKGLIPKCPETQQIMNRWNIPAWLEQHVIERDRWCVYCNVSFETEAATRGKRPSWEHIINDARIITPENIARCCVSCNASKGSKDLAVWIESRYCVSRGITVASVAPIVRNALLRARDGQADPGLAFDDGVTMGIFSDSAWATSSRSNGSL